MWNIKEINIGIVTSHLIVSTLLNTTSYHGKT